MSDAPLTVHDECGGTVEKLISRSGFRPRRVAAGTLRITLKDCVRRACRRIEIGRETVEAKSGDSKPSEGKLADTKTSESGSSESKSSESKPASTTTKSD